MRNHDLKNLVNLVEDLTNYICAIYVYQLHYVRTEHLKLNAVWKNSRVMNSDIKESGRGNNFLFSA